MKPKRKILRFNRRLSYIFISLITIPYLLLNLTDWWIIRLIAIPLFWFFGAAFFLFLAFAPVEYWLSSKNAWNTPKFMRVSRVLVFALGFWGLMYITVPYVKGVSRLVANGGELEKVTGIVKRVDVQFPSSISSVEFKIEGRKDEISLYYPKLRIAKRFPVGSRAEFYLLPGTDYAMDVRPASAD
ncbi:MAG: hypothetical protein ABSA64_03405 [Sedimentisphaerales bacterium]|jgi:predicted PurR-regulated permease PerM